LSGPSAGWYLRRIGGLPVGTSRRVQIQVPLPYGREPLQDERIKKHLDAGWRISQLQRLTDQEVLVTFEVREP